MQDFVISDEQQVHHNHWFLLHKVINKTIKNQAVCCTLKVQKVKGETNGLIAVNWYHTHF